VGARAVRGRGLMCLFNAAFVVASFAFTPKQFFGNR
jgi:hypothetical protein